MIPWLSVVTVPRRLQYLTGTLNAIDGAGGADFYGRRVVFVDGAIDRVRPHLRPGWDVESLTDGADESRGTRRTVFAILHRAAVAQVPYLLFFEDDLVMVRNAVTAMARCVVPDQIGFLSFFQMNKGMPAAPGIHRYQGRSFWGNQALKFPGRSLIQFAGTDDTPPEQYEHSGDIWLGNRLVPGIVLPAIVRHIGAESSLIYRPPQTLTGPFDYRGGLNYAGDGADALTCLVAA
jgi:hypothetical protein